MPTQKRGLGKGLGALIPTGPDQSVDMRASARLVAVDRITPNPRQPRHTIDPAGLADLTASIREHGLIQPLIVTAAGDGYQLIAGERRWAAAQAAGLREVPVVVKDATPQQMLELALVENIQRADLNPLEEALAYRQLMDEFGLTQEEVAERVGKSRVAVANTVRLLGLPPEIQAPLAAGEISEGHARALLRLEDQPRQMAVLRRIRERSLSVRQTEDLVRQLVEPPATPAAPAQSPETAALETRFRQALGTKVTLQRSKKGGRLVIHFYSDEELQGIYENIVGDVPL
ncbi:MAG: ParB/RepB/Spo0J family partition protein [Chloroflexi bacterium]|nr:ParB/RepB/Spo0J family partition protein [Chloroflexota bacterium]MBU1747193.1 ParB/RepB/Spo0J family partition protein [Chloroflexota bacterium]MBU1879098.1 ParB/RepB/Spo0J family partition protein [Chloroflexota bacterium]